MNWWMSIQCLWWKKVYARTCWIDWKLSLMSTWQRTKKIYRSFKQCREETHSWSTSGDFCGTFGFQASSRIDSKMMKVSTTKKIKKLNNTPTKKMYFICLLLMKYKYKKINDIVFKCFNENVRFGVVMGKYVNVRWWGIQM